MIYVRVHNVLCIGCLLLVGTTANVRPATAHGTTCFAWLPDGPEVPCKSQQTAPPLPPEHTPREIARDLNDAGLRLIESGDRSGAIEKFKEAMDADPNNDDARANYYGETAMQQDDDGDLDNAFANARRAASYDPSWSSLEDKINNEKQEKQLEAQVHQAVVNRQQENANQAQEDIAIAVRRRQAENERRNLDVVKVATVARNLENLASRQADSILKDGVGCYDNAGCITGDAIPRFIHRGSGSLNQHVLEKMNRDPRGQGLLTTESGLSNQFAKSIWEQANVRMHLDKSNDVAEKQNLEVDLTNKRESVTRTAQSLAGAMTDVEKQGKKYVVKLEPN